MRGAVIAFSLLALSGLGAFTPEPSALCERCLRTLLRRTSPKLKKP
jgi:hypothetical protein